MVELIKDMIRYKVEKGEHRAQSSFVDVLIDEFYDASDPKTIEFICGAIIEMMIPGQDSVPMTTTLAIKYMTDYPAAINKLRVQQPQPC